MTLRDKIAQTISDTYQYGGQSVAEAADAILALPEIADLQKKLAEVEAERDDQITWVRNLAHEVCVAEACTAAAEAAIPRAYRMGLEDAATEAGYSGAIQDPRDGSYAGSKSVMGPDVANAIRAIHPPADLVDQCKKGDMK